GLLAQTQAGLAVGAPRCGGVAGLCWCHVPSPGRGRPRRGRPLTALSSLGPRRPHGKRGAPVRRRTEVHCLPSDWVGGGAALVSSWILLLVSVGYAALLFAV